MTDKGDVKTGSDNKRKAENGDDNTEDWKKQKVTTKSKMMWYGRIRISLSMFSFLQGIIIIRVSNIST